MMHISEVDMAETALQEMIDDFFLLILELILRRDVMLHLPYITDLDIIVQCR